MNLLLLHLSLLGFMFCFDQCRIAFCACSLRVERDETFVSVLRSASVHESYGRALVDDSGGGELLQDGHGVHLPLLVAEAAALLIRAREGEAGGREPEGEEGGGGRGGG